MLPLGEEMEGHGAGLSGGLSGGGALRTSKEWVKGNKRQA